MPRNPSCQRCRLHYGTSFVCVPSDGVGTGKVMLVGEAPGAEEEKLGRPFVGSAGRILDRALGEAGLSRSDVVISNLVRCRPPDNRTPHKDEAAACLPYLLEDIETYRPRLIVCLGGAALDGLTG